NSKHPPFPGPGKNGAPKVRESMSQIRNSKHPPFPEPRKSGAPKVRGIVSQIRKIKTATLSKVSKEWRTAGQKQRQRNASNRGEGKRFAVVLVQIAGANRCCKSSVAGA